MKIFELIYGLTSGGAEKFVVNLSNEFIRNGHEVVVCTTLDEKIEGMSFNKKFLNPSVKIINLGHSKGFNIKIAYELEDIINKEKPDIIHCHLNIIPYLYRIIKSRRYPIFQTIHNIAPKTYSGGLLMKCILKYIYKKKYIIPITISEVCQSSFIEHFGLPKINMINNGVPKIVASPKFDDTEKYIKLIKENDYIFLHAGRFSPQKNQNLLIKSFNELDKRGYNFQLLVLGAGFDSPEAQALKRMACKRIHFLGEKENLGDYLLCSDAFCLTSTYEGLPLSLGSVSQSVSEGSVPQK